MHTVKSTEVFLEFLEKYPKHKMVERVKSALQDALTYIPQANDALNLNILGLFIRIHAELSPEKTIAQIRVEFHAATECLIGT